MSEMPEPWRTAAERAGVRQTYRGIGEAAGLSHVTVRRLIAQGRTTPATISAVADALRVSEATVTAWADVETSEWGPWVPPRESHRLNPRARQALEELIRAVTEGGQQDGAVKPAQKTQLRPTTRADVTRAARPGRSAIDRYRQSIADAGEESQIIDDEGV